MTRRAGTASAAGMLERNSEIHGHVEKRLWQTVMRVFELAVLELDGRFLAVLDKRHLGH
jgi:hypothetical protein